MKKIAYLLFALTLLCGPVIAQKSKVEQHIAEGVKLHDNGEYKKAIDEYKKALKVDPKSPMVHYEMASSYFAMKDYKNAIEHSDVVIDQKGDFVDMAYVIKGSALDLLEKPEEAIKAYKKGIKENKDSYMLHYNLALTYYNHGDKKNAEKECVEGLTINRSHASSHLLLAYMMNEKGSRTKTLLACYHFLLIEPTGKRAEGAYQMLTALQKKGVEQGDHKTTINISMPSGDKDADEFSAAELMISLLEASKSLEENEGKNEEELFFDNTNSFLTIMGELKKEQKGFWWDFYVDFFYSMVNAQHVEAMSYYVSLPKKDNEEVKDWLGDNEEKMDALFKWYEGYGQ